MNSAATFSTAGILPRFVTPSDVRDLKNRVDPFVVATDAAVAGCVGLSPQVKTGWDGFSRAWRSYFNEDDSWWHTAAQMDQGEAYERDLAHWQDFLAKWKCAEAAPRIEPLDGEGGPGASPAWASGLKFAAIAAVAIAGVVALRTVVR